MRKSKKIAARKSFSNWIIQKFITFRWSGWLAYCLILFFVGTIINYATQFSFPHFLTHQILLITATTMLVYAMKSFFKDICMFGIGSKENLLSKVSSVKGLYEKQFLPLQRTPLTFLVAILVTIFFFSCIVLLEYIKLDIVGIYAIYIAGSSVLIGVYGYLQYLYFLWFIYRIGECEFDRYSYNIYAPAGTLWVSQIAKTSQRLRSFFLFIGLIYVIEYSMLIPTDKIELSEGIISLSTPNNTALIISWIALFLLVIIAFPIINYVQHMLVVRVVNRLKAQTVGELTELMYEEQRCSKNKKDRMFAVLSYSTLIENIHQSKNYPIKRHLSYETLMTLVTFVVHVMNLYSKIASIPQFNIPLS